MRARWLKPEFFTDKKVAQLGPVAALVYQALWCMSDDYGTVLCDADAVKAQMFYRWGAVGVPEISGALQSLADVARIERYVVGDDTYARIVRWTKHQQVHKPGKHRNPTQGQPLTEKSAGIPGESPGELPASPPPRHLDSKTPRHLSGARAKAREPDVDFEVFWNGYPRRGGSNSKALARRVWDARRSGGVEAPEMIAGAERYARFIAATGKVGTEFVKQAAAFLGAGEHWTESWLLPAAPVDPRAKTGQSPPPTTEQRQQEEARERKREEARAVIEREYIGRRDKAVAKWRGEHPADAEEIERDANMRFGSMSGNMGELVRSEYVVTQIVARAGIPTLDQWTEKRRTA